MDTFEESCTPETLTPDTHAAGLAESYYRDAALRSRVHDFMRADFQVFGYGSSLRIGSRVSAMGTSPRPLLGGHIFF